eukprot:COSAG01_NODE_3703_length_5778_cov_4.653812_1_plen_134_part_00
MGRPAGSKNKSTLLAEAAAKKGHQSVADLFSPKRKRSSVTSVSGGTPARTQGGAEKQPADSNCSPTGFAAAAADTGGGAATAVDTGVGLQVPVTQADVAAAMMGLSGQPVVPAPSPSLAPSRLLRKRSVQELC